MTAILAGLPEPLQQSLTAAVTARSPEQATAAAVGLGTLEFIDGLFEQLLRAAQLHPRAAALVQRLRPLAAASALHDNGWPAAPDHPLGALLEELLEQLTGWDAEAGRGAVAQLQNVEAELAGLAPGASNAAISQATASLSEQATAQNRRLERLEQRLIATELGQLRARRARQIVARALNQKMGGKRVTQALQEFLAGDWYHALQRWVLEHGDDHPGWQQLRKLTETLVWAVQPPSEANGGLQQRQHLLPPLQEKLGRILPATLADDAAAENWLQRLAAEHLAILQQQPLDYTETRLLANNDPTASSGATLSRGLLERASRLETGQWFLLVDNESERRARLLLKLEEAGQLLFVNRLGVKTLQSSIEEFAYRLATGSATLLPGRGALAAALEAQFNAVNARLDSGAREQTAAGPATDPETAATKARAEAAALRKADRPRQSRAGPVVGDWVEFRGADKSPQRLKLAVILPGSDKYLFVDRNGRRGAEHTRAELGALLAAGTAQVLAAAPTQADPLARAVDQWRSSDQSSGASSEDQP